MLTPIYLYDEPSLGRTEIRNVIANRVLAAKAYSQLIISEPCPEAVFCMSKLPAEFYCSTLRLRIASLMARHLPPPNLPYLHPAKTSVAKMGEGQFQLGHPEKCSFLLYIPLPKFRALRHWGRLGGGFYSSQLFSR